MVRIIISIKKKPINLMIMIFVFILYLTNNLLLKKIGPSFLKYFFVCHFNDLLCPSLLLGYSNILLLTIGKELKKLHHILMFCLAASIVWEFVAPVFKKTSITDWFDVVCYLLGGIIYWTILQIHLFLMQRKEK